jgi:hypothetical protein
LWQQGQDRQKLEATRPGLYQAAAQDIRTNSNARARAAETARQNRITNTFKADALTQRGREFAVTQAGKAADRTAKQKASDFLDWYQTEGLKLSSAKVDQKATEFGVTSTQRDRQIKIEQQNANTAATRASKPASPKVTGSDKAGRYVLNPDGTKTLVVPPVKGSTAGPGGKLPTAAQTATQVQSWKEGKPTTVRKPVVDAAGKPVTNTAGVPQYVSTTAVTGKLSYIQAYKRLIAEGHSDKAARKYLDSAYQRGDQGRAWLSNEEQAALDRAGVSRKPAIVNGHPVLGPGQVAALKKAKKLPPGQLTKEGAFVIAQTY